MTKEEVIRQAWLETGFDFKKIEPLLIVNENLAYDPRSNGWLNFSVDFKKIKGYNKDLLDFIGVRYCRPKSLKGLETNNGWIKIESKQDLPKDQTYNYDLCHISKDGYLPNESFKILKSFWESGVITHYQPSFQREKPLY